LVLGVEQSGVRVASGLILHWLNLVALIAIVVFWERQPLALERLTVLWRSKWAAGAVTLILFTLAHIPAVGIAGLLPVCIVSVFVTLLYLWRRDLILNMIAHATIDAVGLLLAPVRRSSPAFIALQMRFARVLIRTYGLARLDAPDVDGADAEMAAKRGRE
jgi:Type II CAAX prenyl endopeptidase Rce1-like